MPERLICLLPVRNAAADLPAYFASVRQFCDAVVALDDGSTDETRALLEAEPLVQIILANPRRADYRGWDDAANRNKTLAAAAALDPTWLISLDADERIDAADAAALRAFLDTDALPGCAYGFRHVPMRGGPGQFLPRYQWIYRLFAFEPGQRFPPQRLHFVPVPTSIPRSRWIRTTLRVQHLGGMTPERRLIRFSKYLEADPGRVYQHDYSHLLTSPDPTALRTWNPRPPDLPVLLAGTDPDWEADSDLIAEDIQPGSIALSAIVIARNDAPTIARTVASVAGQICPVPFEVIVVVSGSPETAAIVHDGFPDVTLVELPDPVLPGAARNAGLRLARGHYVSFPGSHVELPPGSLAARLAAHERGYAMVTGVTSNGNRTIAGWASYFLDHHAGLPGHSAAELNGPPAHCSYARLPLLEVGGFPEDIRTGEDTTVNRALVRRGYVAIRAPSVTLTHRSPCRTLGKLLRHHFGRGRGWGRLVLADRAETGPVLTRETVRTRGPAHLTSRLHRISEDVALADPSLTPPYRAVRPLVGLGATAAWIGMWWEILRPTPGKLTALIDHPVRTILVIATDAPSPSSSLILRLDRRHGLVQTIPLPSDLPVSGAADGSHPLHMALTEALEGDAADRRDRIRSIVAAAIHLPLDDYLAGHSGPITRLLGPTAAQTAPYRSLTPDGSPSTTAAPPGRLASIPSLAKTILSIQRGSITTSLSAWNLYRFATGIRHLTPVSVTRIAPAHDAGASRSSRPVTTAPDPKPRPRKADWMP